VVVVPVPRRTIEPPTGRTGRALPAPVPPMPALVAPPHRPRLEVMQEKRAAYAASRKWSDEKCAAVAAGLWFVCALAILAFIWLDVGIFA
jgi:hypothetical protein